MENNMEILVLISEYCLATISRVLSMYAHYHAGTLLIDSNLSLQS
jgi:hypothetical protein